MDLQVLVHDPALLSAFVQMVVLGSATPYLKPEIAAFVVRHPGGALKLVRWPRGMNRYAAKYRGSIPAGLVAIVHTHPEDHRLPSQDDFITAHQFAVPVLVLTRAGIAVANPNAADPEWLLRDGGWTFGRKPARGAEVASSRP